MLTLLGLQEREVQVYMAKLAEQAERVRALVLRYEI